MSGSVYFVHCIDTEGPLAETPVTWRGEPELERERVALDSEDFDLAALTARHRPRVLGSWTRIVEMLADATSKEERMRLPDSSGGGWRFNWFCMDHLGFEENPRRRDMGIHHVFDFYNQMCVEQNLGDSVHWHFHPESVYSQGHMCATSYVNSPSLYRILCRRLIERGWFARANRSGFNTQRPDSHWFLEQWVPFDFSNMATQDLDVDTNKDLAAGRYGDWRRAPADWSTYHPSHDDYQIPGHCRRRIARSQNLLNRFASLNEAEVDAAFARAESGEDAVVGMASHDWRDLRLEMDAARWMIARAAAKRPEVSFHYCEAVEAFARMGGPAFESEAVRLVCHLNLDASGRPTDLSVEVVAGTLFGPQPFLAIETRSKLFRHEPFDVVEPGRLFAYVFDAQTVRPDDLAAIGVATNDAGGRQSIHRMRIDNATADGSKILF